MVPKNADNIYANKQADDSADTDSPLGSKHAKTTDTVNTANSAFSPENSDDNADNLEHKSQTTQSSSTQATKPVNSPQTSQISSASSNINQNTQANIQPDDITSTNNSKLKSVNSAAAKSNNSDPVTQLNSTQADSTKIKVNKSQQTNSNDKDIKATKQNGQDNANSAGTSASRIKLPWKKKDPANMVVTGEPIKRNWVGWLFYYLGSFLVKLLTKFELRGQKNIPKEAPFILAPNHETYVDGLLVAMGLPKRLFKKFCALAAKELEESRGGFGKIIMRVGRGIPIDRKGSATQSLKICIKQLANGNVLLIHPEGTRTADGKLGVIKEGTCYIAQKANVPIVPVFIDGGYEIYSRHMSFPRPFKRFMKRRRLIVTYGEPIYPDDYENSRQMTQILSAWLHNMYDNKEVPREYEDENLAYIQSLNNRFERRREKQKLQKQRAM